MRTFLRHRTLGCVRRPARRLHGLVMAYIIAARMLWASKRLLAAATLYGVADGLAGDDADLLRAATYTRRKPRLRVRP